MIDVARDVLARRSVDRPARIDLEQIAVVRNLVALLVGEQRPRVFDNIGVLLDRLSREHAEPGTRASDAEGARTVQIGLVFLAGLGGRHSKDVDNCDRPLACGSACGQRMRINARRASTVSINLAIAWAEDAQ